MPYAGGRPYGDIFIAPTSAADEMAARLYAEHDKRQAQQQKDLKELDDMFAKNVAGIKSADIDDVTNAFNDFKQSSIALMKKGGKVSPKEQMDNLLKRANAYEKISKSKEDKERIKQYGVGINGDKKGRYNPNAVQKASEWLNTPTAQRNIDKDQDELMYKYSYPNLSKLTTSAMGKATEYKMPTGKPSPKGNLYDDEEVYNKYNSPNQIFDHIFNTVAADPNHNAFTLLVSDNMTDLEKEDLKTKYFAKINDPLFKKVYGEVAPFSEAAGKTDLGEAAALTTMGIVVNMPVSPLRTDSKVNENRKRDANMNDWLKKNSLTFDQSMIKIKANKSGPPESDPSSDYISDITAHKYGEDIYLSPPGSKDKTKKRVIYVDKVDPERLLTIVGTDSGGFPLVDAIEIKQPDGTYRKGYTQNQRGDWEGVSGGKSATIGRDEARERQVIKKKSTKFKAQALQNETPFLNTDGIPVFNNEKKK